MKIEYSSAPLPGEHNNGEIWVHWNLEIGGSKVKGCAPTREKAEIAVSKQINSYNEKYLGKKAKGRRSNIHSSVVASSRSV